jgi:hypothetical protein
MPHRVFLSWVGTKVHPMNEHAGSISRIWCISRISIGSCSPSQLVTQGVFLLSPLDTTRSSEDGPCGRPEGKEVSWHAMRTQPHAHKALPNHRQGLGALTLHILAPVTIRFARHRSIIFSFPSFGATQISHWPDNSDQPLSGRVLLCSRQMGCGQLPPRDNATPCLRRPFCRRLAVHQHRVIRYDRRGLLTLAEVEIRHVAALGSGWASSVQRRTRR